MKLATVLYKGERVIALVDAAKATFQPLARKTDMAALIAELSAGESISTAPAAVPLSDAELLAPLSAPPTNIMCVGKNYRSHAKEFARSGFDSSASPSSASPSGADDIPTHPIIFTKPSTSISSPSADIPLIEGLDQGVDYEAELAVVIGKPGRFIPKERAMEHVFGFTVVNDVTARDLQKVHKQWFLGKGIDGFCPMGPWIVTRDEVDSTNLRITCMVNGELRQDGNTGDLIFDIPTLIETISRSVTLRPGNIIATGTPEGVGIGFTPPRFLADGDIVECAIEGIGSIRNRVRRISPGDLACS